MAFLEETRFIERLQFFNGQRLFASDLQGIEAFNREMRWLHNKSLHQPGIGSGLAVYGKKGDRKVTIGLGYAIDALGREIVLTETQIEAVPPVSAEPDGESVFYDLTVSYPDDSELEEAETREGVCLSRGVVRLREAPVFCWARLERDGQGNLHAKSRKLKEEIKNGLKIVLARLEVLNCQLEQDVSIAQRRSARPAKQPYITCGKTDPSVTEWKLFFPEGVTGETALGLQVDIDTSAARFSTTPCYSAHIVGNRLFSVTIESPPAEELFLLDGFINVVTPTQIGFTLNVLMPRMAFGDEDEDLIINPISFFNNFNERVLLLRENGWHVVWMGIEG